MEDAIKTVMFQCELWADNSSFEESKIPNNVITYDFASKEGQLKVADNYTVKEK